MKMVLVTLALVALAGSAAAAESPRTRGPAVKVVRPSSREFTQRVRTEVQGPIGLTRIANSVWAGPTDEPASGDNMSGLPESWLAPTAESAWGRLREIQNAEFPRFVTWAPE